MRVGAALVVVALAPAAFAPAAPSRPVSVSVRAADPAWEPGVEELTRELRKKPREYRVVPEDEPADIVLTLLDRSQIKEASSDSRVKGRIEGRGGIKSPFPPESVEEFEVKASDMRRASLVVRAQRGEFFRDLTSHPSDRSQKAALHTVMGKLQRFVREPRR